MTLIKFGAWEFDPSFGIDHPIYNHDISKQKLWEYVDYNNSGVLVWEQLLYFAKNRTVNKENANDLNTAFLFAQDYFRHERPYGLPEVSLSQTLYVQQQIMTIIENHTGDNKPPKVTPEDVTDGMAKWVEDFKSIQFLNSEV